MSHPEFKISHDGEHPALPEIRVRDPFTLMIFGGTGDLNQRKLMPGLFAMKMQKLLPDEYALVGSGRSEYDDDSYRELIGEAVKSFSRVPVDDETLKEFLSHVYYIQADVLSEECYQAVEERFTGESIFPNNRIFYLSVKPKLFAPIVEHLHEQKLTYPVGGPHWSRVVIEKPFGRDFDSARELNLKILNCLEESQIYRIDHYLGKETVQNILSFRFANGIFEPVLHHHYVESIQITSNETVGMESGRGAYYDQSGAMRDMVQNHLLQLLCLVTMDAPSDFKASSIHNEKIKVLRSIQPPTPGTLPDRAVRGQYTAAEIDGDEKPGYLEEEHVDPESTTETYAALRLTIQNWRWAGVPVYVRTGKRMPNRQTDIVIQFKTPPLELFQTVQCEGDVCDLSDSRPNRLIFRIQPEEGIAMTFSTKRPGLQVQVEEVKMDFSYQQTWNKDLPEAYERLLLDVMRGDSTLFMRSDEVEAAWRVVDPYIKAWEKDDSIPMYGYPAGSWGPKESKQIFKSKQHMWWST